jgi:RNA polymerase sigma-70 factor (ECF subfamily)
LKVLKQRPDERLVIEAAQRDPARFAELYEDNFERVYAFVARRVYVRADAEDLTAEVFQQALAKLSGFEWRGVPFAAWLYRIAANAIADRWKRAAREQGSPIADDPPDPHSGANPEEIERTAQLFRLVIEMRFAEEKSIREIAKALKRTAGAVKQLQFRGIQKLRDQVSMESGTRPGGRNG